MNRNIYYNSDEELLENINKTLTINPTASQRTIAENCNISLGMANAVLKRFVERGWILITNINATKVAYALSEEGIRTLAGRSYRYIKRTFCLINEYSVKINEYIFRAREEGKKEVVLVGESYIKFLLECACQNAGLKLKILNIGETYNSDAALKLLGELSDNSDFFYYKNMSFISVMDLVR